MTRTRSAKNETTVKNRLALYHGDITELGVCAIVNAANRSLLGGGGVDGAIQIAGPKLLDECKKLGGCKLAEAKITRGYKLPARHVIHTVGPVGERPEYLEKAYRNSLRLAVKKGLSTIAFPCISTGVYGYPDADAAKLAFKTVIDFLEEDDSLEMVVFCVLLDKDYRLYEKLFDKNL